MKYFGILIDPSKDEVTRVEMDDKIVKLSEMYSHIECEMVERAQIGTAVVSVESENELVIGKEMSIDLWFDEEGLLNGAPERIGCFKIHGNIYCGKGLIILSDYEGESISFDSDHYDLDEFAETIIEIVSNKNNFTYA